MIDKMREAFKKAHGFSWDKDHPYCMTWQLAWDAALAAQAEQPKAKRIASFSKHEWEQIQAGRVGMVSPVIGHLPSDVLVYFASPAPSVPEGWKLVPVRMTDDMAIAFAEVWFAKTRPIDDPEFDDAYAAMLAAAPEPKP